MQHVSAIGIGGSLAALRRNSMLLERSWEVTWRQYGKQAKTVSRMRWRQIQRPRLVTIQTKQDERCAINLFTSA